MKTILAATDFSPVSNNAIDYAVEIAKLTQAKLVLFHAFHMPVVTAEVPVLMPTIDELEKDCMETLKKLAETIQIKNGGGLTIECVCKCGFAVDEIDLLAKAGKIDFIVMGLQGAGVIGEKLIGSVTTSLISKTKCPVLAIAENVRFKSIKRIVLACDYLGTNNKAALEPLKDFAKLFNSRVYVLNVSHQLETVPVVNEAVKGYTNLEESLNGTDHAFYYTQNEDIVNGINDFVSKEKMDMVVMIPRRHSMLQSLFKESNTKRMAFHTDVPLLALHD